MSNTSATGGILTPANSPAPLEDQEFLDFIQAWVVALVNIDPTMVRPRWQETVGNIPANNVNWIAIGITKTSSDTFAAELHSSINGGYNELRRHEEVEFLASSYGPNCESIMGIFRDGMQISQNREVLSSQNMGLISTGDITPTNELVKQVWYERRDMQLWIRRQVVRRYGILNLGSVQGILNNEIYVEPISAEFEG